MITDRQVRLMRQKRMESKTQETAAAQAGMSVRSARKWQSRRPARVCNRRAGRPAGSPGNSPSARGERPDPGRPRPAGPDAGNAPGRGKGRSRNGRRRPHCREKTEMQDQGEKQGERAGPCAWGYSSPRRGPSTKIPESARPTSWPGWTEWKETQAHSRGTSQETKPLQTQKESHHPGPPDHRPEGLHHLPPGPRPLHPTVPYRRHDPVSSVPQTGGMEQGKKTVISVLREALH